MSSTGAAQRDAMLNAQFELSRKLALYSRTFNETLDRKVAREVQAREPGGTFAAHTDWTALTLVDDKEVENQVSADRFALEIQSTCEWEIRELDAYIGSLLGAERSSHEHNPLRPEIIGMAMIQAIDLVVTERPESRKVLASAMGRALAAVMRDTYVAIVAELRNAGVKPMGMTARVSEGPGYASSQYQSGYDRLRDSAGNTVHAADSISGRLSGANTSSLAALGGVDEPVSTRKGSLRGSGAGTPIGHIEPALMNLIRQLAFAGVVDSGPGSISGTLNSIAGAIGSDERAVLPNLIVANRDQLRSAAQGSLDHMVIDVVGGLFDQILSDPKVAPQMARQIARLQLPVLRAALGDPTFFSSRRHPVRRFVNRIASLGAAYDDFDTDDAKDFLKLVKDLVQDVVQGDFDQIELYEKKLEALEAFIGDQTLKEVRSNGHADELLARKETEARAQYQFSSQLQDALQSVPVDEFLRQFLASTWSRVVLRTADQHGAESDATLRARRVGRDLVMSVQPKGTPEQRKAFLAGLPQLMKDLNAGLDLIGLAEPLRKDFFGQLLPAHADSLKGKTTRVLEYNLLAKQIDQILATPLPQAGDLASLPGLAIPELHDAITPPAFSAEEAASIGLIDESQINWDGKVDIELGAEPEVTAVDISIEGLPAAEELDPSRGRSLAQFVQIGLAYQMHMEDAWHKVRLAHMSPGRSFFVFTRGGKHKRTISMTQRMLVRLCETGRMRAFENGYLLERATARARRQLAQIMPRPVQTKASATRH